jgi:hypothetical protein
MHRTTRHALVIAAAAAAIAPTQALARGGTGGGGGTPTGVSGPCLTLKATNSGSEFKRGDTVRARFNLTNCSTTATTVTPAFTSISTPYSSGPIDAPPVSCAGPSGSGVSLSLKPGEQRSVELAVPPSSCPMGPSGAILEVDATARDATATAYYQITLRP